MKTYITKAKYRILAKYLIVKSKRPRIYSTFDILNAIFHILVTGSQWHNLPNSYPPFKTVYYHFRKWKINKTFHYILSCILSTLLPKPRVMIIDTQSVSDSDLPAEIGKGYDGHKRRKGRKRCILVDTKGNIHCLKYFSANTSDIECAKGIIEYYRLTSFGCTVGKIDIYADKGFHSPDLKVWALKYNICFQSLLRCKRPDLETKIGYYLWRVEYGYTTYQIKQVRYVVERTFAWLQKYRRLNMNYEKLISSFEAMTILAGIRIGLRGIN